MNIKEIKEMIELMNDNGLSELELQKNGLTIRLRKGAGGYVEQVAAPVAVSAYPAKASASSAVPAASPEASAAAGGKHDEIKSPMVGTFYKAASPDSPSYVKPGDEIEEGQVVCIIEAMKLMNEIKSEVKGRLISVLVENTDPVEFGQPLFLIEPHA